MNENGDGSSVIAIFKFLDPLADDASVVFSVIGPEIDAAYLVMGDPNGVVMAMCERVAGVSHAGERTAGRSDERIDEWSA